jgi:peroxiredoxin
VTQLVALGFGGWLGYELLTQNGRLLVRIEALEQQLAELTGRSLMPDALLGNGYSRGQFGSPVASNGNALRTGTVAPTFRLPRVDGGELALDELRGRPVLLVFSDPACGPCDVLAPKLERLHRRLPDLQILIVSRGDPDANRAKVAEHGLTFPVVLQRRWEISREYGMFATPIGYLLDEEGVIKADVAVGTDAILALGASHPLGALPT